MDKEKVQALGMFERKQLAVAYLLINPKIERPAGTEKMFEKLNQKEVAARKITAASSQARNALLELENEFNQNIGSIKALVEMISEDISDELATEYCEKYEPRSEPGLAGEKIPPQPSRIIKPGPVDMAGATAHMGQPQSNRGR